MTSTGMFPTNLNPASTYANKLRRPIQRKLIRGAATSARQLGKKRGPYKIKPSPKRELFAELLSADLSLAEIADRMGITPKAVERQLASLRKRMGPQAR